MNDRETIAQFDKVDRPGLIRYAESRLHSHHREASSEDLVQSAYLAVWKHRERITNAFWYMIAAIRHGSAGVSSVSLESGEPRVSLDGNPLKDMLREEEWALIGKWGSEIKGAKRIEHWRAFAATGYEPPVTHAADCSISRIKETMRKNAKELGWEFGKTGK